MVIDTSAVLAILQLEPEAELFATLIEETPVKLISSVSVLEAAPATPIAVSAKADTRLP